MLTMTRSVCCVSLFLKYIMILYSNVIFWTYILDYLKIRPLPNLKISNSCLSQVVNHSFSDAPTEGRTKINFIWDQFRPVTKSTLSNLNQD